MKTGKGYKLFECNNGLLYPLFIDKKNPVEIGVWLPAKNEPTKGFAKRPGWHVGTMPDAPWLKSLDGTPKGCYKSQRFKHGSRVWCEVEYQCDIDYNAEAQEQPKKCFTDKIPVNGFYEFREAGKGTWVISGMIKVTRIIPENERIELLNSMNYNEIETFAPYKTALEKRCK